jgi:hypothetical protein
MTFAAGRKFSLSGSSRRPANRMLCLSGTFSKAAPMTTQNTWKETFTKWPAGIPRRGLVVNNLNEAMPFKAFMTKDDTVLLERSNPDSLGARYILIGYDSIDSVKFIDPIKESIFTTAGFVGKLAP